MPGLQRIRERLPLVVFVLLLLLLVMLAGFACACLTDHPMQAIERVLSALAALPTLGQAWPLVAAAVLGATLLLPRRRTAGVRAPPALLQRFLF